MQSRCHQTRQRGRPRGATSHTCNQASSRSTLRCAPAVPVAPPVPPGRFLHTSLHLPLKPQRLLPPTLGLGAAPIDPSTACRCHQRPSLLSDWAASAARTGMLCLWERVGRYRDAVVGRGVDGRWVGRHCGVQFAIRGRCSCRAVREPLGEAADRRVGADARRPVHERDRKPNRGKPVSACRHALQRGAGLCRRACEGRHQPW
jgi:hypothetical protein